MTELKSNHSLEWPNPEHLHNVYEDLSDSEKEQAKDLKQSLYDSKLYTDKELLLAEFGRYYGWQALKDAAEDRMTARTFIGLLEAGRKIERTRRLERLDDISVAVAAVMDKKAASKINSQEKKLRK